MSGKNISFIFFYFVHTPERRQKLYMLIFGFLEGSESLQTCGGHKQCSLVCLKVPFLDILFAKCEKKLVLSLFDPCFCLGRTFIMVGQPLTMVTDRDFVEQRRLPQPLQNHFDIHPARLHPKLYMLKCVSTKFEFYGACIPSLKLLVIYTFEKPHKS